MTAAYRAHNKRAFDFLGTRAPEYADWQITTLFYAALHGFNRHFEQHGIEAPPRREAGIGKAGA